MGFVIKDGVLVDYIEEPGVTDVIIPSNVKVIGSDAFRCCVALKEITLPISVTRVEAKAFSSCKNLLSFTVSNPKCEFMTGVFGDNLPDGLFAQLLDLIPHMKDRDVCNYAVQRKTWDKLSPNQQASIYLSHQSKIMQKAYLDCLNTNNADALCQAFEQHVNKKSNLTVLKSLSNYIETYSDLISDEPLISLFNKLCCNQLGKQIGVELLKQKNLALRLASNHKKKEEMSPKDEMLNTFLKRSDLTKPQVKTYLKKWYELTLDELPMLLYKDGETAPSIVLAALLVEHDNFSYMYHRHEPGVSERVADVLAIIDQQSFQNALRSLAKENWSDKSKINRIPLAEPICQYADEELMSELLKMLRQENTGKNNAYSPLYSTFRSACIFSTTRSALKFAERNNDLWEYAMYRVEDVDTIRDKYLTEIGLDENGTKTYDLGNIIVAAQLQDDLTFLILVPGSTKPSKSLPKRGANPDKYKDANDDFTEMKFFAKSIVKKRVEKLFSEFLNGKETKAKEWKELYLKNPLLRRVARLLIWSQSQKSFILTNTSCISHDGKEYVINNRETISVAHPIEMSLDEIQAWQEYFLKHKLKQPFEQMWEPAFLPEDVKPDRYDGCTIFWRRVQNAQKHGISFEGFEYHAEIEFTLKDCILEHQVTESPVFNVGVGTFTLGKFAFEKYTRQVNHLVYLFDKWTIWDRIRKDDVLVMNIMNRYNAHQITEFLRIAIESNAALLTAALLAYKNNMFPQYDEFSEFTLE